MAEGGAPRRVGTVEINIDEAEDAGRSRNANGRLQR